ncbi:MAG: hypothetical protein WA125_14675, partial [Desulfosporosinus sp.]
REEVTNHVLLGRKSRGGPYYIGNRGSEQTVRRANIEVRRINEYCSPEREALQNLLKGFCVAPTQCPSGEGRSFVGRNG